MVDKIKKVMREFEAGKLHSGSKQGPLVTKHSQAVAIALSEARKAGKVIPKRKYLTTDGGKMKLRT